MKRSWFALISPFLCAAMLSGCDFGKNAEVNEMTVNKLFAEVSEASEAEESTEAPAEAALPESEETPEISHSFKLAIEELSSAQSEITELFNGLENGERSGEYSRSIEGVTLDSWGVKDEEYYDGVDHYGIRYIVTLTLDVKESENEYIPVGKADYLLIYHPAEDRAFLPLRRVDDNEYDENNIIPTYDSDRRYVDYCNSFTAYFSRAFAGDIVTDFSAPDTSVVDDEFRYCAMAFCYSSSLIKNRVINEKYGETILYDEMNAAMKAVYGFSADSIGLRESRYYLEDTDSVAVLGRDMFWYCGYLSEDIYNEQDDTHTITIDYYEDDFYMVKSQTYRYTVRENGDDTYTIFKMERLFTSDRGILNGII